MRTKSLKLGLLLMMFAMFLYSCGNGGETEENNQTEGIEDIDDLEDLDTPANDYEMNKETPIICMWSKVTVRNAPTAKGKWVTSIYLGESATYLAVTEKDTTVKKGKEYAKIELIDGTTGWVDVRYMAIDAIPYVVKGNSKLYKRPDILTATKKEYEKMQFVVVIEGKDEWVKVKGKRAKDSWFSEGWMKANHLSNNQLDINVAILAGRALAISKKEKKIEALNEIIDNSDFSGSIFIKDLSTVLFDLMNEEIETVDENTEDDF